MDYRIQEYFNLENDINFNTFCRDFFEKEELNYDTIISSCTRYKYDDSDFTVFILKYDNSEYIKKDKEKLMKYQYEDKPIFNISGNGWETGLCVSLVLSSKYDN